MTRVVVGGQIRLYREGLVLLLAQEESIEVVGVGGNRAEIVERVDQLDPDVVLVDPTIPEGIETIRELALGREARVIALAYPENETDMIACAEAGVCGYLTPEASVADLVAAIRVAADGELLCSPKMAGVLLRRVTALASGRSADNGASNLTMRELQVVRLIDEGLSNKQIASALEIELSTVKHHVHHILEKLEVARRSQAVARLRQQGLLQR
jgi:DNA-binding NarL/FixJ family response regulator